MNAIPTLIRYQEAFSAWAGCKIKLTDDFETFCDCDFDFIEVLICFENRFSLNLLDTTAIRHDFKKVNDFFLWVRSQPMAIELNTAFGFHKAEIIPTLDWVE